jgi:hypothetical protein
MISKILACVALVAVNGAKIALKTDQYDPNLELDTKVEGDNMSFVATLKGGGRWFAVGFSSNKAEQRMIGSQIVLCNPGSTTAVQQRSLNGKAFNLGDKPLYPTPTVTDADCSEVDGNTVLKFTRPLKKTGDDKVELKSDDKSTAYLLFGIGPSGENQFIASSYHSTRKGAVNANLATGKVTAVPIAADRLAHGSLMFLAWGVLAPFGMMIARFGKHTSWGGNGAWFKTFHRPMMAGAVLFTIIGFIIALIMVEGAHFAVAHTYFGLVVVILSIFQPINAAMRGTQDDHHNMTPKRKRFELLHKSNGRFTIVFSILTVPRASGLWALPTVCSSHL